jgi:2-(1,2-epoxy-1,2-dihydrophenyl)acetyl-CoA isomerase
VPTITALNGPAAGAGANLALAANVVIGAKSSYLMQAFSKIGLIPDAGGSYILPRAMGMAKAMGASLFAEKIMAEDAANSGMIWEAVEDEQFETTWRGRAAHLASGPTITYRHIKSALRQSWDNSLGDQLALEAKLQKACGETHDFKEGVLAFLDKRAPKFEGR